MLSEYCQNKPLSEVQIFILQTKSQGKMLEFSLSER